MSCTIVALPLALPFVLGHIIQFALVSNTITDSLSIANEIENNFNDGNLKQANLCDEVRIISEKHFIEKSLETPFMDKELLLKTLSEHGVSGLTENEYGKIKCHCGTYELNFEKMEADKPYFVVIKALDTDDIEGKIRDLNNEYTVNVQEKSYNSIVAKLKENNMQIENEEICEDNTIVLTVNLE